MNYKKWLFVFGVFLMTLAVGFFVRTKVLTKFFYPEIQFQKLSFDFGTIEYGVPVDTWFVFKNTGNKALNIKEAITSCDCTTLLFPNKSIKGGEKDSIYVCFDASKLNHFTQQIYIYSNATEVPIALYIVGDCIEHE